MYAQSPNHNIIFNLFPISRPGLGLRKSIRYFQKFRLLSISFFGVRDDSLLRKEWSVVNSNSEEADGSFRSSLPRILR